MNKQHPDIAALRRELADLWRTLRRVRAERRSQPTAKHRIAQAFSDGLKGATQNIPIPSDWLRSI